MQILDMPAPEVGGKDVQFTHLMDQGGWQLIRIFLRKGAVLRRHVSPIPATVAVISGEGIMEVGEEQADLRPGRMVSFGAGDPHEIRAKSDLSFLVVKYPE